MQKTGNNIFFDNDEEFYDWAVIPHLDIYKTESGLYYTSFELSNLYHEAVSNGYRFIIKDEDSQIYKHQAVSYRTITQPIENLDPYYGEQFN